MKKLETSVGDEMENLETDVVNEKFRNRCCKWKI